MKKTIVKILKDSENVSILLELAYCTMGLLHAMKVYRLPSQPILMLLFITLVSADLVINLKNLRKHYKNYKGTQLQRR